MKFAFLVHPRDLNDVYKKYPILKFLPNNFVSYLLKKLSPIVVAKIHGLKSRKTGLPADGLLVSIGMTAEEMLADRDSAKKEVIKALKFSKKCGAKIMGLGALTSPVVGGGIDLVDKFGMLITNGNALTASMAVEGIEKLIGENKKSNQNFTVAVVGATGSIGSAISTLVAKNKLVNTLILMGRTEEKLVNLENAISADLSGAEARPHMRRSTELTCLSEADLVVVSTSASGAIIQGSFLKKDAIVYDITQPKNTSRAVAIERPDVTIIDGALVKLPDGVGYHFDSGLPDGVTFSCLAETMILAAEDTERNFSVGNVNINNIEVISNLAKVYNVVASPFLSWGKEIK